LAGGLGDYFKSMLEIKKYDLPDISLFHDEESLNDFFLWVPDDYYVVLGNSNKPDQNLIKKNVHDDDVTVYKRPSGGETVILTPRTMVISIKVHLEKFTNPASHFRFFNQYIMQALQSLGVDNLHHRGISDVAIGNKKILGSAIYRKRHILFYHAVLNVSEAVETIARYIKHPGKEPDYREGRDHYDFVTSLHAEGYKFSMKQLRTTLAEFLRGIDREQLILLGG
jgi:lipoate-protein ligase A